VEIDKLLVKEPIARWVPSLIIPTLNDLYRCAQSRIPMGATGFRVASGFWVLGRLVDGMNLESLVGEVNHHKVLIQVAVHKNLATLCIDNNSFDIGNKAQGPFTASTRPPSFRPAIFSRSVPDIRSPQSKLAAIIHEPEAAPG